MRNPFQLSSVPTAAFEGCCFVLHRPLLRHPLQEGIAEYQDNLREVQQRGKTDKVHKYQRKIAKESNKLKQLERELYN